jgi:RES domain-containing protein
MKVYRITTAKWADKLSGSGFPARWNSKGKYVIYAASTRALACLENLVHRSGEGLNQNFKIAEITIPIESSIRNVQLHELPDEWYKTRHYPKCQKIGDSWIDSGKSLLLRVPSSIIREETNILINPNHREFSQVSITGIRPFRFDERL